MDNLHELFDKPWDYELDKHVTDYLNGNKEKYWPNDKVHFIQAHKIENDNGYLVSLHRNGAFEVHHFNKDFESGVMNHVRDVNPRFLSTMIHHATIHGLNKGYAVRIDSTPPLYNHYKRIVNKIVDKNKYKIKEVDTTITIQHRTSHDKLIEDIQKVLKHNE